MIGITRFRQDGYLLYRAQDRAFFFQTFSTISPVKVMAESHFCHFPMMDRLFRDKVVIVSTSCQVFFSMHIGCQLFYQSRAFHFTICTLVFLYKGNPGSSLYLSILIVVSFSFSFMLYTNASSSHSPSVHRLTGKEYTVLLYPLVREPISDFPHTGLYA